VRARADIDSGCRFHVLAGCGRSAAAGWRTCGTHVIVFDIGPNMAKFVELTKRASDIARKYGDTGKARYWFSALAGPQSGTVIVTVEYSNRVAFAQSTSKVEASPEWQAFVAEAQQTSIKPISNSVVVEMRSGS
jgi:hypothetical protein